jgi:hypothetical protein
MSATSTVLAARDKAGTPINLGKWHAGFTEVKKFADANGLPLMAVWSNGELCSHCTKFERCISQAVFKDWMKDSGVVFYFACNEDKSADDKTNGKGYNWCWKNQSLNMYPFVRFYWKAKKGTVLSDGTVVDADKVIIDKAVIGDTLDKRQDKAEGAKNCVAYAKKVFKPYVPGASAYKIRFNPDTTVEAINAVLDGIDAAGGHCPCQIPSNDTVCHCKDFIQNKGIGEPCICGIYVKVSAG